MKKTEGSMNLTEGSVWMKLLVFFLPIAAGTIIQQLYNAVDGLIVGRDERAGGRRGKLGSDH